MADLKDKTIDVLLEEEAAQWVRLNPYENPDPGDYSDATGKQKKIIDELARRATAGEAAAKERDEMRAYIEQHHNGYQETGKALGWPRPETHMQALRELVEENEHLRSYERKAADQVIDELRSKLAEREGASILNKNALKAAQQERDRLAKVAGNAEQGDCLRGELGTVECPQDNPCGVCRLTRERDAITRHRDDLIQLAQRDAKLAAESGCGCSMVRDAIPALMKQRDAAVASEKRLRDGIAVARRKLTDWCYLKHQNLDPLRFIDEIACTSKPPQDQPKPPPADDPAIREQRRDAYGNATLEPIVWSDMLARAILELARRPR